MVPRDILCTFQVVMLNSFIFVLLFLCLFSLLFSFLLFLLSSFPTSVLFLGPGFGCIVLSLILMVDSLCLISLLSITPSKMRPVTGLRHHIFIERGVVASSTPLCCLKTRLGCSSPAGFHLGLSLRPPGLFAAFAFPLALRGSGPFSPAKPYCQPCGFVIVIIIISIYF